MEQVEGCYGCRMLARRAADAQATIAALQARVQELEARQHFGACAKCLTNAWRICKEGTPDAVEMKCSNGSTWWLCDYCLSKEQLTQRTAELEAANTLLYKKNCALGRAETSINDLQAELERVRGERDEAIEAAARPTWVCDGCGRASSEGWINRVIESLDGTEYEMECPMCEGHNIEEDSASDLARERDDLRTLVLALPKVEYEIKASNFIAHIWPDHDTEEPLVDLRASVAALLKHRQGMEG